MPDESFEIAILRRGIDAFNARDIERLIELFEPDAELHSAFVTAFTGTAGVYEGFDGLRKWHRDLLDTWAEIRLDPQEVVQRGDHVLAVYRMRGQGLSSEADVEMPVAHLIEFRRGRIRRLETYTDTDEAAREFEARAGAA